MVIGAGKTGMDACIWLLENGADPDRIRWIVPRDSWVLNRANFQPGDEFFARFCKSIADQVEAVALADSVDDVFPRLEACGELRRIDPTVTPERLPLRHPQRRRARRSCAASSDVVRLGRVTSIDADEIQLEQGTHPDRADTLHVDCSAAGIPTQPSTPVFDGDRITLQWVRTCQPTFSAAFIGHVESTFADDAVKNRICTPIVPPTVPLDWLRMLQVELPTGTAGPSTPRSATGWPSRASTRWPARSGPAWASTSRPPSTSGATWRTFGPGGGQARPAAGRLRLPLWTGLASA